MLIAGRQSARGSRARKLKKKPPVLDYNSIGEPTFMLSVRGVSSSALQQYIATTNKSLQLPPSAAMELSLINGPTSHVRDDHVSVYFCVDISQSSFCFSSSLIISDLFNLFQLCSMFDFENPWPSSSSASSSTGGVWRTSFVDGIVAGHDGSQCRARGRTISCALQPTQTSHQW